MLFSIIYEFDIPMSASVRAFAPSQRKLFDLTEQSDGEPSDWCEELFDGKCKHRKFCAVLTRQQFDRFIQDTGLHAESVETMGSLGAPGLGWGLSPAISFRNDDPNAIQSAYVTPIPEVEKKSGAADREESWQRVRRAVLALY
jgi:hypothetical protein